MANISYCAVIVENREDYKKLLDVIYNDGNKFNDYCSEHSIDYLGSCDYLNKYLFRFECRWEPDFAIARMLSKEIGGELTMWTHTEGSTAPASKAVYNNGKRISKKNIPYDICDADMRECIIMCDWDGVNWYQHLKGNLELRVVGDARYPNLFKAFVLDYSDGNKKILDEQILHSINYTRNGDKLIVEDGIKAYVEHVENKYCA